MAGPFSPRTLLRPDYSPLPRGGQRRITRRRGNRILIWTSKCPTKGTHKGHPPVVNRSRPRNSRRGPQGAPLPIVNRSRPRNRTPEGRPQGAPLPIVSRSRPRNRTPEGVHKGRPYQLSIVFGQETELQKGVPRAPTRGAPAMICCFRQLLRSWARIR